MARTLVVLMDPIATITPKKDSTLAMLLEAQRRGWQLRYCTQGDLAIRAGTAWARLAPLTVRDDPYQWFTLDAAEWQPLSSADVVLARKDPPVDAQFIYDTMVLDSGAAGRNADRERPARPARHEREALHPVVRGLLRADPRRTRSRRIASLRGRTRPGRAQTARRHGRPRHLPLAPQRPESEFDSRNPDPQRPRVRARRRNTCRRSSMATNASC